MRKQAYPTGNVRVDTNLRDLHRRIANQTHIKADITDWAHTHIKADITDWSHTHPHGEISDWGTYFDQAVKTTSAPTFNGMTSTAAVEVSASISIINEAAYKALDIRTFADGAYQSIVYLRRARGTKASPADVQSADILGRLAFHGLVTDFRNAAYIESRAGTPGAAYLPGDIRFFTTDAAGTSAQRAMIDTEGRLGIATSSPTAYVDINADILRLRTAKTPASAGATGNAGDICRDSTYIYVCVATNTWKRVQISTW